MSEEDKAQEILEKFIEFNLDIDGQKSEWLGDVRKEVWAEQTAHCSARHLFTGARLAGVNYSVAYRIIKAAIKRGDCAVPQNLNKIMAGAYR